MTIDEKLEKRVDEVLHELERESTRDVTVTQYGTSIRFELRSAGWPRWIAAGPFAMVALWILAVGVWNALQSDATTRSTASPVLAAAALAFIALLVISARESVVVTPHELVLSMAIGRLTVRTIRVPLATICDVRVGSFSFASWDPYVVVSTEHGHHRFAWSVPQRSAQRIAQAIRHALATGG